MTLPEIHPIRETRRKGIRQAAGSVCPPVVRAYRRNETMSTKIEDGGCAFPSDSMNGVDSDGNRMPFSPGMSLRDWFAGQAIIGLAAITAHDETVTRRLTVVAEAYAVADAMLAARTPARSA